MRCSGFPGTLRGVKYIPPKLFDLVDDPADGEHSTPAIREVYLRAAAKIEKHGSDQAAPLVFAQPMADSAPGTLQ